MTLKKLLAMMPIIKNFTPDMKRTRAAWRKVQALGEDAVVLVTTTFRELLDGASGVGVDLTFHRPATLLNIMVERYGSLTADRNIGLLPPLYKGVSYNPAGANWREWLVLLDFFAIMRQFTNNKVGRIQTAVLDASLYWMVNLLGADGLVMTSPDPLIAAKQMLDQLREHVARRSPDRSVYDIALQRNAYMRAVAEQFPVSFTPPVFTVLDVWADSRFAEFLAKSIRNFCRFKNGRWEVTKAVSYQRYMTYSPWVTPLVVAEQTFMAHRNGFQLFMAPVQEAAWNSAVDEMSRLTGTPPYAVFMYDRPKSGELAYGDFPFFSDPQSVLTIKLTQNQVLLPIVAGYIQPFLRRQLACDLREMVEHGHVAAAAGVITEFTSRVDARARELYKDGFLALPLDNLGWLMQFPPGTC